MKWFALLLGCSLLAFTGCTICCSPYDETYSAYGGRWERDMPAHGRVASAFVPAGHRVETLEALPADEAYPLMEQGPGEEAPEQPTDDPAEPNQLREIGYPLEPLEPLESDGPPEADLPDRVI